METSNTNTATMFNDGKENIDPNYNYFPLTYLDFQKPNEEYYDLKFQLPPSLDFESYSYNIKDRTINGKTGGFTGRYRCKYYRKQDIKCGATLKVLFEEGMFAYFKGKLSHRCTPNVIIEEEKIPFKQNSELQTKREMIRPDNAIEKDYE